MQILQLLEQLEASLASDTERFLQYGQLLIDELRYHHQELESLRGKNSVLQEREKEIVETQDEIVSTLGAIAETRSNETGNHVKRVAEYSKILAIAYGLKDDEAEVIRLASPLHDIGNVAVPDRILNKPEKVSQEEFEIIKSHTVHGYEMLKGSDKQIFQVASIIAHEHHEKYDGTGYPRGLRGKEIHVYGRITAIADVFDSLGSDRVYKKAWDEARIFRHLRDEQGIHFDPHLIDLFFENIDDLLRVRDAYKDIIAD